MEFTDCLSAVKDFLCTKETFKCSSEEVDSFLQTLSIAEEVRSLVKETIMKNPPPTLKVHGETVSLSSCYTDSIRQIQNILQKDRTGKLSHIMQQIRKSLGHKVVGEISLILEMSGEEIISVRVCEQKQHHCEAKVKMHHYLLLEGLQDIIACLSEIGNGSVEDVWKSCRTSSAPLAMQKVGMNIGKFEKTLKSYPEAFHVEDSKVFLKDNPRITYSLILNHMQSAKHKLKDHLLNQGPLLKNELFRTTSQLLSGAEILAMGGGYEAFTFTLQSLRNDFLLIPPHMLVVAQGTLQVKDNPFVSAVAKIKDFIRSENAGNGSIISKLLTFVNKQLDPYEEAAVGNTSQKLRETIATYPDHFSIKQNTVFIKSDDAILLDGINLDMQKLQSTKLDQEIVSDGCSSDQSIEHSEDSAHCEPLNEKVSTYTEDTEDDACGSVQTSSLEQDEVESLGSETISDSESLHSGMSGEVENLDPDTALPESTDEEIVTILKDRIYFGELIKKFLHEATYPILSVSLSDGWLIIGLWDGHTFAICLTLSPCDHQKKPGQSERIALDFLTNKSILKVVFDGKQIAEINDALGIKMIKVFDLRMAQSLIRPSPKKSLTLLSTLSSFGIDPCPTVEVCIGTIQAPVYGEVFSKEAILKLKETARWTMKQVPCLYQKMLGMMTSYQITKVSKFHDAEVEDQPVASSHKEEPFCSSVTSSKTSPEKSRPVTSSMQAKAGPEKPVSVHRVSSTSGDLDGSDNGGHVSSRNDPSVLEEDLQHDLYGPEVDSTFLLGDSAFRNRRSRTTSHRSKKVQTTKKQEKSPHKVTGGMRGTSSQTASGQESSAQWSPMSDAKVLHYEDYAGKPTLISLTSKLANQTINPCQISHELSKEFGEIVMHDQDKFLEAFGICVKYNLKKFSEEDKSFALDQLTEVVMDVGRRPSARYYQPQNPFQWIIKTIGDNPLTKQDLKDFVEGHCSPVSSDRRTSIKDTLHRVGIMCNRQNEPIGLTALTKHAVLGCATPLFDLMNQGQSILFVGNPGVGKSTILREAARVINDVVMRRVVIIDTCNEITGDGDIPHPAIGGARRVQLADRDSQPDMIREVVRNHSPLSVIIDEVVTEADAAAVLATRQRGIQVISSAPGQTLQDVILNPNLRCLSGRIQNMAMNLPNPGHRGTAGPIPTVMQRTQPAAFDILVEMHDRYRWIVHMDLTRSVDLCLQKVAVSVQERRVFLKEVSKDSNGIPQVMVRDLVVMFPL